MYSSIWDQVASDTRNRQTRRRRRQRVRQSTKHPPPTDDTPKASDTSPNPPSRRQRRRGGVSSRSKADAKSQTTLGAQIIVRDEGSPPSPVAESVNIRPREEIESEKLRRQVAEKKQRANRKKQRRKNRKGTSASKYSLRRPDVTIGDIRRAEAEGRGEDLPFRLMTEQDKVPDAQAIGMDEYGNVETSKDPRRFLKSYAASSEQAARSLAQRGCPDDPTAPGAMTRKRARDVIVSTFPDMNPRDQHEADKCFAMSLRRNHYLQSSRRSAAVVDPKRRQQDLMMKNFAHESQLAVTMQHMMRHIQQESIKIPEQHISRVERAMARRQKRTRLREERMMRQPKSWERSCSRADACEGLLMRVDGAILVEFYTDREKREYDRKGDWTHIRHMCVLCQRRIANGAHTTCIARCNTVRCRLTPGPEADDDTILYDDGICNFYNVAGVGEYSPWDLLTSTRESYAGTVFGIVQHVRSKYTLRRSPKTGLKYYEQTGYGRPVRYFRQRWTIKHQA